MMLEALSEQDGESHPLSINRLAHARTISADTDTITRDLASEHLTRHGVARESIL